MPQTVLVVAIAAIVLIVVGSATLQQGRIGPPRHRQRGQAPDDEFRHAMHDLLMYSPDRETLARRAVTWAERLVGGRGAFLIDSDGAIIAADGMEAQDARRIVTTNHLDPALGAANEPRFEGGLLMLPLDLQAGRGAMVIVIGGLARITAAQDLKRLGQYATSISAGLDRVTLTGRIQVLEKAKSEFLSVASHELRGPMTVIKGYLTMLDAGSLGEIAPRAQAVLPLLISKADEVSWMLEQMVEASRLEEGRLALKKQRHDLVPLTDSAIAGVKLLLTGHEVTVGKPATPIEADVDPDRFQIVIRNLLTNAAKYSPAGTEIKVTIAGDEENCAIAVTDWGAGISPEDQAKLFTRFGRIDTTQHVQGTGLGLWLSREIARMHEGDLTVESQVGRGSTFVFRLPLQRQHQ